VRLNSPGPRQLPDAHWAGGSALHGACRVTQDESVQPTKRSSLRAFLALDLDDEALGTLSAYLRRLQAMPWANAVRWVSADNLHLTLRFLGDITPAQAEQYADALRRRLTQVADLPGLSLRVSEPRFFPRPAHPRVIACVAEGNTTLTALADLAEACAIGIGLAAEKRPFNGHITLGRLRDPLLHSATLPKGEERILVRPAAVTLYKSELSRRGAIYTALRSFSLRSQL